MQIHRMGGELFHADGQTGRQTDGWMDGRKYRHDEANSSFSQFCERIKKKKRKKGKNYPRLKAGENISCKIQLS